jgi:hypothetical protein
MARLTLYRPASVRLSQFDMARLPPDELAHHPLTATDFDTDTLFFDVIHTEDGRIACLGPPLDSCEPAAVLTARSGAGDSALSVTTQAPRIRQQYSTRTFLSGPALAALGAVEIRLNGIECAIAVQPEMSDLLAGRRVLLAVSRDNPLNWVEDWAQFYAREHGADAVILYDNGSTLYSLDELADRLAAIEELAEVIVVQWPFRYGIGGDGKRPPYNFCQTGAIDHARRHFCSKAASVLSLDIDELIPRDGRSIFERVERSRHSAILFHGIWIEAPGIDDVSSAKQLRHRDCSFAWREQLTALAEGRRNPLCRTKWVAVPARCGDGLEWGVHEVYAATRGARLLRRWWRGGDQSLAYRHFRQINNGWKTDRWRSSPDFESRCIPDTAMIESMARAFRY